MEWLWLLLSVVGLGVLWLLIMGVEKLTARLKANDEARRYAVKDIEQRTSKAEALFVEEQEAKAEAKSFIENADFSNEDDPENAAKLHEAIDTLSSDELLQSVAKRMFGVPEGTDGITASQSAFDQVRPQKVVASGDSVSPIKVKSADKPALSKSEQKMLKKIKQGD